jgi:hypothetical protein
MPFPLEPGGNGWRRASQIHPPYEPRKHFGSAGETQPGSNSDAPGTVAQVDREGRAIASLVPGRSNAILFGCLTHQPKRADCGRGRSIDRSRSHDSAVPVARGGAGSGRAHARGDGSGHGDDRGTPVLENGAAPGHRSPRSRLLHRPGKRQRPGVEGEPICRCPLPLVPPSAPTGPGEWSSGGGR